jgi:signal recognition particle subunit SRP68
LSIGCTCQSLMPFALNGDGSGVATKHRLHASNQTPNTNTDFQGGFATKSPSLTNILHRTATLQLLRNFVQATALLWTRERDLLLVETLQARLKARETGRKAAKPEDVVKLFEVLLQCTEDYGAIEGVEADEGRAKAVAARTLMFKAWRVLYIGEAYVVLGKMAEAAALVGRARELEKVARLRFGESNNADEIDTAWLDSLKDLATRRLLQIRALAAESTSPGGVPQAGSEGGRKGDAALRNMAATPLSQRMGSYEAAVYGEEGKMPRLVDFPPPIDAVACKPVLFDLALNYIAYPSLDERTKKKAGGVLGWFRR